MTNTADATNYGEHRLALRAERARAAPYWGGFQLRIVLEFLVSSAAWITVIVLGTVGIIPLGLGLVLNTIVATTFYMPMHEATHGNIWGRRPGSRTVENLIGIACSIPLGLSYEAHRVSHMRHHAFTNDPDRDPDRFTDGPLHDLPAKWFVVMVVNVFLPVFAFVPSTRRLLPAQIRQSFRADGGKRSGLVQLRFWLIMHSVLLVAFLTGFGWPALFLWYIPARLQAFWLLLVFAWYPHHPAAQVGRYVDTRVAVFPESGLLLRGHDHHALHHLFPRVPHYRLRALWQDVATDMVAKGVRSEGQALEATRPIIW
jgi:beta-carotene hydroxylase